MNILYWLVSKIDVPFLAQIHHKIKHQL